MTADPIGQEGGLNLYAYADNDPLSLSDPLGLAYGPISGGLRQPGQSSTPDGIPTQPRASMDSRLGQMFEAKASALDRGMSLGDFVDFAEGLKDGVKEQLGDIWQIIRHPSCLLKRCGSLPKPFMMTLTGCWNYSKRQSARTLLG